MQTLSNGATNITSPLAIVLFSVAHIVLSCVVKQAAYERGRCQYSAFFLALFFSPLFGFLWIIAAGSDRKVLRERARREALSPPPRP